MRFLVQEVCSWSRYFWSHFMRALGPCMVVGVLLLILSLGWWYYFGVILGSPASLTQYLHGLWFLCFYFNIISNYLLTVFTHPGRPWSELREIQVLLDEDSDSEQLAFTAHPQPSSKSHTQRQQSQQMHATNNQQPPLVHQDDHQEQLDSDREEQSNDKIASFVSSRPSDKAISLVSSRHKYCDKCQITRVARSHHCRVCQSCILKKDHHCPWVANCVGHFNHRFFYLFLLWVTIGCGVSAVLSWPLFQTAAQPLEDMWDESSYGVSRLGAVFLFIFCVALSLSVGFLFCFQTYLVGTGQTTIEFYINQQLSDQIRHHTGKEFHNPYDLGWRQNFEYFFGSPLPLLHQWLLFPPLALRGNGITFPIRNDIKVVSV